MLSVSLSAEHLTRNPPPPTRHDSDAGRPKTSTHRRLKARHRDRRGAAPAPLSAERANLAARSDSASAVSPANDVRITDFTTDATFSSFVKLLERRKKLPSLLILSLPYTNSKFSCLNVAVLSFTLFLSRGSKSLRASSTSLMTPHRWAPPDSDPWSRPRVPRKERRRRMTVLAPSPELRTWSDAADATRSQTGWLPEKARDISEPS